MTMTANRPSGGRGRQQCRRLRDGSGPQRGSDRAAQRCGARQDRYVPGTGSATRTLVAVGTCLVHDLRDADGLVRPLLRRAALSLAVSRGYQARRLGNTYLRLDPPAATGHNVPALPARVADAEPHDALLQ